jgi:transcriptional regulator with XRE-family HTH domain
MLEINKPQTPEVRSAIERLRSRMNIGRIIVAQRLKLGLTQDEIARRAGTKQSRISELETLAGNVRLDTLDKIALTLDLEVTLQPRFHAVSAVTIEGWAEDRYSAMVVVGSQVVMATSSTEGVQERSPPSPNATVNVVGTFLFSDEQVTLTKRFTV